MSDISPFSKEKIVKSLSAYDINKRKPDSSQLNPEDDKDAELLEELADDATLEDETSSSQYYLPQDEVLGLILEGYSKTKNSVLASRIIVNYYIHLREYNLASEKCRDGIKTLADIQRTFGIDLTNTKEDFCVHLQLCTLIMKLPKL